MADSRPVVGSQVRLSFTTADATGALTDATTQTVTVTLPDGTSATPSVTHDSTGTYHADYTVTAAGRHEWYATTTGPVTRTPVDVFNASAITLGPIVGLTELRNHLNLSSVVSDSEILAFAARASDAVEAWTGQTWRQVTVTEKYDGGVLGLLLRTLPVQSIVSVTEFGQSLNSSSWNLDINAGVLFRGTTLVRIRWLPGAQNVTVTYQAGPTGGIVPTDVLLATMELTRHFWETQRGGSNLPRQQGAEVEYDPRSGYSLPRRVIELLDTHQAPGFA